MAKEFNRIGPCSSTPGSAPNAALTSPCSNSRRPLAGSMASRLPVRRAMLHTSLLVTSLSSASHFGNQSTQAAPGRVTSVVPPNDSPSSVSLEGRRPQGTLCTGHSARSARLRLRGSGTPTTRSGRETTAAVTTSANTTSPLMSTTPCWPLRVAPARSAEIRRPKHAKARSCVCVSTIATAAVVFAGCCVTTAIEHSGCSGMMPTCYGKPSVT